MHKQLSAAAIVACFAIACTASPETEERGTWVPSGKADDTATCQDRCGWKAEAGCWCDCDCIEHGDCCPDFSPVCVPQLPEDGICLDSCQSGADCSAAEPNCNRRTGLCQAWPAPCSRQEDCDADQVCDDGICVDVAAIDDHGDTPATATPIAAGAPATPGTIETEGDPDYFALDVQAGHIYAFRITVDTLYSATGVLLGTDGTTYLDSFQTYPGYATNSITHEYATAGTYFFAVHPNQIDFTGTYTVEITDLGLDDFGDTVAEATALVPGAAPISGAIETAGDMDVFSLEAEAGRTYTFEITVGTLYSATGVLSDATTYLDDFQTFPGYSTNGLSYQFATAGTYFFKVRGNQPPFTGSYTVSVR